MIIFLELILSKNADEFWKNIQSASCKKHIADDSFKKHFNYFQNPKTLPPKAFFFIKTSKRCAPRNKKGIKKEFEYYIVDRHCHKQ